MLFFFVIVPFDELGGGSGTISELLLLEFLDKALGSPEEEGPID
jgi:hypothetical protein